MEENLPPWKDTAHKIRWILEQIFDPNWTGKKNLCIEVSDTGVGPKRGLRYVKVYRSPALGMATKENVEELIRQWRKEVEPYLIHINRVVYRTSTRGGASRLYLLYDRSCEGEENATEATTG